MGKKEDQISIPDQATEAAIEAIKEPKPKAKSDKHAADCQCSYCLECLEWRK